MSHAARILNLRNMALCGQSLPDVMVRELPGAQRCQCCVETVEDQPVDIPEAAWNVADGAADRAAWWDSDGAKHYDRHVDVVVHAVAPPIDRAARVDVAESLIRAFVVKEAFHEACGNDGQAAGIRECVTHLRDYLETLVAKR